jgi:hypothetical protein
VLPAVRVFDDNLKSDGMNLDKKLAPDLCFFFSGGVTQTINQTVRTVAQKSNLSFVLLFVK